MSKLAVLSLRNRALIALITIVAAVFGGLALTSLKQELIPSIQFPGLIIVSTYPGASPDVVNNDVSGPVETAVQGVPGLEGSTATSSTNASVVQLSFAYGTDLNTAEQKVSQALNRISNQLPDGVDPQVLAISIDDFPVIQLAVSTAGQDPELVQSRLQSVVVPKLEQLDGVNAAQIIGGLEQQITITPDRAKLAAAGYSQAAITDALDQNGILFPGGAVTENDQTLTVQTGSRITTLEQLKALPLVATAAEQLQAGVTTIADVATVELAPAEQTSISRVNGEDALTIAITKLPSANTVEVSHVVQAELDSLSEQLGGAKISVLLDQAPYIEQSIETLAQEGLLGLVFAVIVILVFLMSIRSTLVTAISIPTSVLVTFIGIQAFGYSLNILTLGALTMAIGRVVDDAIVVIENIKRHYVEGADKLQAIQLGVREVAGAITASTLTTVAVFLPIAFVADMAGELFRPFALTVTIAMLASLLVALTIVPVLAYWFMKPGKPVHDADGNPIDPEDPAAPPTRLQRAYLPILRTTLKHSAVTLLVSVLILGGSVLLATQMKQNFLGDAGQNSITMSQKLEPGASLEAQNAASKKVEETLLAIKGVDVLQVSVGSSGSALRDAIFGSAGVTYSMTTDPDMDQVQLRQDIQNAVNKLSDVGEVTIGASAGIASNDIEIEVTAPDATTLQEATQALVDKLKTDDSVQQVTSNLGAAMPFIAVEVDRDKAASYGLSEVAVGGIVSATMRPQRAGTVEIDDTSVTIYIAAASEPQTLEELRNLQIPTAMGVVTLADVATVAQADGPMSITTDRGQRTSTITITPKSDDLSTSGSSVQAVMDSTKLPQGAHASLGGVVEQQLESFAQLGLAMLAAILIVYVIMVATFKSLRQPLLLLISVPFAATGAIALQVLSGVPLGMASLIGVLMLIGIVVTNAIVLVDLVNQYRRKGLSTYEATITGSSMRLRPILMTALATIFALTPMALGITGHGGFISQPLAIVVIGGLISSTLLTLLVLPTLFNLVEGAKERRAERRARRAEAEIPPGPMRTGEVRVVSASDAAKHAAAASRDDSAGDEVSDEATSDAAPADGEASGGEASDTEATGGSSHGGGAATGTRIDEGGFDTPKPPLTRRQLRDL